MLRLILFRLKIRKSFFLIKLLFFIFLLLFFHCLSLSVVLIIYLHIFQIIITYSLNEQ